MLCFFAGRAPEAGLLICHFSVLSLGELTLEHLGPVWQGSVPLS